MEHSDLLATIFEMEPMSGDELDAINDALEFSMASSGQGAALGDEGYEG